MSVKNVLECSSRGDKRFSALYAEVEVCGKRASIEEHYQLAKRFPWAPKTWHEAKGRKPVYLEICGQQFPVSYLTSWYALLWLLYLDAHPELVEYAKQFDDYSDCFAKPNCNSQADMVRVYVRHGREALLSLCKDLLLQLKGCKI